MVVAGAAAAGAGILAIAPAPGHMLVASVEILVEVQSVALLSLAADVHGTAVLALPIPNDPLLQGYSSLRRPCFPIPAAPRASLRQRA